MTGKSLFDSGADQNLLLQILYERPVPPDERVSFAVPAPLSQLIMECLEKAPANRPASVEELLQRLDAIQRSEPWTQEQAAAWWQRQKQSGLAAVAGRV